MTEAPRALAVVIEFMAIAQLQLGYPYEVSQQLFERALTLDPLNERIRHNYRQAQMAQAGVTPISPADLQIPTNLEQYRPDSLAISV